MADEQTHSKTRTETGTASTHGPGASRTAYSGSASNVGRRTGPNWAAAIWAGVIAGAVFMMLEMIMVPLFLGMSGWGPPRMIAAIVVAQGVLPPPATFDSGILMVAMMVHFVLYRLRRRARLCRSTMGYGQGDHGRSGIRIAPVRREFLRIHRDIPLVRDGAELGLDLLAHHVWCDRRLGVQRYCPPEVRIPTFTRRRAVHEPPVRR